MSYSRCGETPGLTEATATGAGTGVWTVGRPVSGSTASWVTGNVIGGIASRNAGVSHVAHLGGMAIGYVLIRFGFMGRLSRSIDPLVWLQTQYKQWKLARARKKFEVYMRNQSRH